MLSVSNAYRPSTSENSRPHSHTCFTAVTNILERVGCVCVCVGGGVVVDCIVKDVVCHVIPT